MTAAGKKFADESETLRRIGLLDQKINAIRDGSADINLGGVNQSITVLTEVLYDVDGHITGVSLATLLIVDGVIVKIT